MKPAIVCVAALSAAVLACQSAPQPGSGAPGDAPSPAGASQPAPSTTPHDALDRMDTRVAVPLLPMMAHHQKQNMRDHLVAVQEIAAAAAVDDFAAIEKAAGRIGYSEQMGQMCTHMGAGAPGFTDKALEFHHSADRIGDAARKKDMGGVWKALGETLATCTGCHATFKQRVVDEATWSATTRQAAPGGPMRHP